MIRRLMASTAMLALITSGAIGIAAAQDQPVEQPAVVQDDSATTGDAAATPEVAATDSDATLTPEEPTIATAFIGTSVYSSEDPESDNIGEVNDLIIGENGMITHAVVGVGGFLGIGEKDVAVPFDELQVVEQDGDIRLIYAATREQLEAAVEFDRTAYDPDARAAEEQALQDQAANEALEPADPMAPAEDMAAAPAEEPLTTEEPAEDMAAAPAEEPLTTEAPAEDMAAAPAEEEPALSDVAAAPEEPVVESTDTAAAPAEEPTAESTDMAAAPAVEESTDTTDVTAAPAEEAVAATAETDTAVEGEEFVVFDPTQVRASTLIGQEVFGADEQSIGEISDLVLQEDGETRAAVIDVGGFLGIGEKPVGIGFDQLDISSDGDETRVAVAATAEELEAFPAYEAPEDVATTDVDVTTEGTDVAVTEESVTTEGAAMTGTAGQDFSANELLGAAVTSPDGESVGEVNDVIFSETGTIDAVLVDVGGFLGAGEKQVAFDFDSLNVTEDESGEVTIGVDFTQEQLEGAPAYEEAPAQ